MNELFKLKVENVKDFDLTAEQAELLDIVYEGTAKFHILKDHKAYRAELVSADFDRKHYSIRINSNTFHIQINNELDRLIKKMGFTSGASKKLNQIKAPMPGIIIDVKVKEGDTVKEDDPLLILEAMKMENVILSPKDGLVKSVHIQSKDTVDKGKLLIELE